MSSYLWVLDLFAFEANFFFFLQNLHFLFAKVLENVEQQKKK
jgi:hypothetical protein